MKNKYIPLMIITFMAIAFAAFSTILNIIRQEVESAICSFIIAVFASCWFGILVVAVIRERERIRFVKIFKEVQEKVLKKLEEIRENQENKSEPFEEFNGVKDDKNEP